MRVTNAEPITAWDANALRTFANGREDILVIAREALEGISPAIREGRIQEIWGLVRRETVEREVRLGLRELEIASPELAADIIGLATSFLEQFDAYHVRLRLEVTRSQSCPKFHCDNLHTRLVTTYFGPTTEYQYAGDDKIHAAPLYGLVFLKGYKHPNHHDSVHHRSPAVPDGEKRLCVAVDYVEP